MSLVLDDLPRDPDRLLQHLQQMAEVIAQQNARIVSLQAERDTVLAERDATRERGASRDREAAALDPAAAARAVRPALGEARPRPAAARPGGPRADRGGRRGGAGGGFEAGAATPRPPRVRPTQPGRLAGAPAAGRGPGRRRGQELPLLRRGLARDRRGHERDARHRPRPAAGEGDPPTPLRLPGLRGGGGAGPAPGAADHRRDGDRGAAGARAGGQVRRFPAALPPGADLRPARDRARPLHALRLGGPGLLVAGAAVAPAAPARHELDPDLRRRHALAGARPRPGPDQDRGLWGYAVDDRPWGGSTPPAVVYLYAEDRKGEHPAAHLAEFQGILQVDGYCGLQEPAGGPPAGPDQARLLLGALPEALLRDPPGHRLAAGGRGAAPDRRALPDRGRDPRPPGRGAACGPAGAQQADRGGLARLAHGPAGAGLGRSTLAEAIRYALRHWQGLVLFLEDGRLELDTNTIERAIRPIALGRKNSLFAGSDGGARHWAIVASLVATAKLNGVEPLAWLTDVLERMVWLKQDRKSSAPWPIEAKRVMDAHDLHGCDRPESVRMAEPLSVGSHRPDNASRQGSWQAYRTALHDRDAADAECDLVPRSVSGRGSIDKRAAPDPAAATCEPARLVRPIS